MEFRIDKYIESKLSPSSYFILYAIVHQDDEFLYHVRSFLELSLYNKCLKELEVNLYIKLDKDNTWILRKKALSLQAEISPEIEFDKFWDKYHEVTGQKKTDLQASLKHWKKLTKTEKQLAIDNIKPYFNSLPVYSTGRPIKKARTYLGDKNFNDEFEVIKENRRSLNKMIN